MVVTEGQCESRSTGSYSLRVYAGTNPRFPHDDFVTGTVRARDGAVEQIRFSDLDDDGLPDIIVTMRSVGTGGYLSADAFRLRGRVLMLLGSVTGLPKDADPIDALKAQLTSRTDPSAASEAEDRRR